MPLATLIGGAISAGSALISQHIQNERNKQERELAYRRQQAEVARQNAYNSPAEQVERLRSAGLNANLAYGAQGATVGNQDATPEYLPADYQSGIAPASSGASEMINSLVGLREQKNKNLLAIADLAVKDAQSFSYAMSGMLNQAERFEVLSLLGYKRDKLDSEIRLNENEIQKIGEEFLKLQAERDEIRSRIVVNEQQIKTLASQYDMNETQVYYILSKLPHELRNMDANTAYQYVMSEKGRAEIEKIALETSYIDFYAGLDARKVLVGENQYYLDKDKFNFHKDNEFRFEVESWVKTRQQEGLFKVGDWISRVAGLAVGGAVMGKAGSNQRHPSPIITPSGGSYQGWNYVQ